jgi:hypothetical protein
MQEKFMVLVSYRHNAELHAQHRGKHSSWEEVVHYTRKAAEDEARRLLEIGTVERAIVVRVEVSLTAKRVVVET